MNKEVITERTLGNIRSYVIQDLGHEIKATNSSDELQELFDDMENDVKTWSEDELVAYITKEDMDVELFVVRQT